MGIRMLVSNSVSSFSASRTHTAVILLVALLFLGQELAAAEDVAPAISRLNEEIGLPSGLSEYGLSEAMFPRIVQNCRSRSMRSNPREPSDEELIEVLRKVAG